VLPARPLPEIFADPGAWNRVPLLLGSNRDEMKLFLALSERHARQRFGLIPEPRDRDRYERLARYHSEAWAASGVFAPLQAIHGADPALPLFAYRFDWDAMRRNFLADLPALLGAAHGLELDFLFAPLFAREVPGVVHAGNRADFAALGRSLRDYWAGFAHSGNPGAGRSATQPLWPAWTPQQPRLMILDDQAGGGPHVAEVTPHGVEALKAELAAEEGLPERLRCALYVDLFLENSGLPELFDTREYHSLGCAPFPAASLRGLSR
jgi:para-nitrobenzyl esterase